MVAVVERVAVKKFTVKYGEKRFDLQVGRKYDTAKNLRDGEVFVFSQYWLWVPAECFGMGPNEQRQAALDAANERARIAWAKLREANIALDAAERDARLAREALEALQSPTSGSEDAKD